MFEHFRRADEVSRFLSSRGVPVVEPVGVGPVRWDGLVVSFASYVEHDPGWRPDSASFASMVAELHAELRHFPGDLPVAGPLRDIDAVLELAGGPSELVSARDELSARWPELPVQALHGDAHPRNVLLTDRGPVWNDFEDAWLGPVGWDVACAARSSLLVREVVAGAYPADELAYWIELRELFGRCWQLAVDIYRARTRLRI
ncbi:phosphotransferase family protein [Actinosynnema sp. CS-041913]|uniref:phosphotransferase family protein n=1 Tax=Actinosynnema sp. CS-041913 TaxID=3239917 RepID=UPI003D945F3A